MYVHTYYTYVLRNVVNFVTEIPPVNDMKVVDNCVNVMVSWNRIVGPCANSSYVITLSSSNGDTMGPFMTNETSHAFSNTGQLSGMINVTVIAVYRGNAGKADVLTAEILPTSKYM